MKTPIPCSIRFQWTAQDLVDAIPLRLSEMAAFAAVPGAYGENDGHFGKPSRRELRGRYVPGPTFQSLFRVHN